MAYVAPTNVATGDVLTASRYNADVVANMLAIRPAQVNVQQTFKTDVFTSTGTHTNFQDVTGLSVSITPSASTSKVLVIATFNLSSSIAGATHMMSKLLRGSTALGVPSSGTNPSTAGQSLFSNQESAVLSIMYLDSPATTSATTYKIQAASTNNSTWYCNQRGDAVTVQSSSITVIEIPV